MNIQKTTMSLCTDQKIHDSFTAVTIVQCNTPCLGGQRKPARHRAEKQMCINLTADSTAQHSTAQHSTAQHSTAQHSTAQHSTAQHRTAQHSTAQHSTAQHSTAQHSTAQHSTAQHSTAQVCTPCWHVRHEACSPTPLLQQSKQPPSNISKPRCNTSGIYVCVSDNIYQMQSLLQCIRIDTGMAFCLKQ